MARIIRTSDGSVVTNSFSEELLATLIGANMNVTTDQQILFVDEVPASYIITKIVVDNASVSLTTAAGGIYDTTAKGGNVIVAAAQTYSALTAASKYLNLTLATFATTDKITSTTLYLSLTTAQGVAATADVRVYGVKIS